MWRQTAHFGVTKEIIKELQHYDTLLNNTKQVNEMLNDFNIVVLLMRLLYLVFHSSQKNHLGFI